MSGRGCAARRAAAGLVVVMLLPTAACTRPGRTAAEAEAAAEALGEAPTSGAVEEPAADLGTAEGADGTTGGRTDGDADGGAYLVAEALDADLQVYDQPVDHAGPVLTLAHPTASGAPLVLLVMERREDWLAVLLPIRPNGSTGWVRGADVSLSAHRWRIDVHLASHELVVRHGEEVWMVEPIAVGHRPTPTPGGTFYLIELLQPPEPNGPYGPYAFGLSGFSEVLESFGGGDGRLGLHGTDDPASLGGDVTNGCIRLANEAITQLARTVPLGTPLTIQA